jgi:hypothetical protein
MKRTALLLGLLLANPASGDPWPPELHCDFRPPHRIAYQRIVFRVVCVPRGCWYYTKGVLICK